MPHFECTWLRLDSPTEYFVDIDLSHNSLFNIDGDILWSLPHLEVLNLSHCALRQIPVIKQTHRVETLR